MRSSGYRKLFNSKLFYKSLDLCAFIKNLGKDLKLYKVSKQVKLKKDCEKM